MKRYFSFILILFMFLLVTGCGSSSSGTIICKSDVSGSNPQVTRYEKYVVEDNKVVDFVKYNILDFDDSYLDVLPINSLIDVYAGDESLKVEMVDSNTLKTVMVNADNIYEGVESKNLIETIHASFVDNPFSIYKYTCVVK